MDTKKILLGAVVGLVSAMIVDLDAYQKASGPFDWKLAGARWAKGLLAGGLLASGAATIGA